MYTCIHSLLYILLFCGIFIVNCQFTGSEHIADTSCGIPYLYQISALCQNEIDCIVSFSDVGTYLGCWNALGGLRSLVRMFFGSAKSATHSDTNGFGVPGWEVKQNL